MTKLYKTNRSQCWLEEFPSICIDRFDTGIENFDLKEHFFLTNAHDDHIWGLMSDPDINTDDSDDKKGAGIKTDDKKDEDVKRDASRSFFIDLFANSKTRVNKILYIHETTLPQLLYLGKGFTLKILEKLVKSKKIMLFNSAKKTFKIMADRDEVNVQWHSAGHCPGSVMYSFWKEKEVGKRTDSILYTGECLLSIEDLKREFPSDLEFPRRIYLDTTYCHKDYFGKIGQRKDYIYKVLSGENQQRTFFVTGLVDQLYLFHRIVNEKSLKAIVKVPSKGYLNMVKLYLPESSSNNFIDKKSFDLDPLAANGKKVYELQLYSQENLKEQKKKGDVLTWSNYGGSHFTTLEIVKMFEYFNLSGKEKTFVPLYYSEKYWKNKEFDENTVSAEVNLFLESRLNIPKSFFYDYTDKNYNFDESNPMLTVDSVNSTN